MFLFVNWNREIFWRSNKAIISQTTVEEINRQKILNHAWYHWVYVVKGQVSVVHVVDTQSKGDLWIKWHWLISSLVLVASILLWPWNFSYWYLPEGGHPEMSQSSKKYQTNAFKKKRGNILRGIYGNVPFTVFFFNLKHVMYFLVSL